MEGLEATEIRLCDLERTKRIDAEFFKKSHVLIEKNLASRKTFSIADLVAVSDGNHFSISDSFIEGGIPYYRGQDVTGPFFIEQSKPVEITPEAFADNHMKRSHLKKGDVLLSIVGTVGALSLVGSDRKATCSCKLAIFRPHSIEAEFLAIYLESKLGASQIQRFRRGTVQTGFLLEDVDQVLIPQLSTDLTLAIVGKVQAARTALECSEQARDKAEQTLLSALNLENWQPPNPLTYDAPLSAVAKSSRFDAEYFHPEKHEITDHIKKLGSSPLSEYVDSIRQLFDPKKPESAFEVINYDLSDALPLMLDSNKGSSESLELNSTKKLFRSGDLLVSRLRYYLKEIAVVPDSADTPQRMGSTEFIVLRPKNDSVSSAALCVYLRSAAAQSYFKWCRDGSMHPRFSESDLLKFPVPKELEKLSPEIESLFFEVCNKRSHSKSLLTRAKRAVEIAIEQDEKTALAYLDGKHYVAGELLPKLFGLSRHYIDLATIQKTIEAEALHYESATIKRYLQDWMREGRIHDAGRGWYSDLPEAFLPDQNIAVMQSLQKSLKQDFPLLDHTLWSTRELAAYFHHLPTRHATFLMVDRDAFEPVADSLRDAGHRVVIHPLGEAAKSFSLETEDTIILRPRLSSDHVEKRSPIEHTLIDLYYEIQKLGLYELEEYRRLLHNLTSAKRINLTAFKRYAERRKIDVKELLPSII